MTLERDRLSAQSSQPLSTNHRMHRGPPEYIALLDYKLWEDRITSDVSDRINRKTA